eukprot:gnl/Trimastix_PCT/754.p1 GENE.gnl/Trimastix_PCT/754~~gnl/Trimastix_PCT/754.p1  ORF type:complete len:251 (+),score=69.85 gnl/Trimastix_PCT/754:182-934(+)
MSGGIDSAASMALCRAAQRKPNSPIKKILGVAQPIKSTATIQNRAYECCEHLGTEIITVDQSAVYDTLVPIVHAAAGMEGGRFETGQLRSYMRTPVAYYVAQLLSCNGNPCAVIGTGNLDEDGYLFYFCKAGDGISDLQLISDLHKSEVFAISAKLDVPRSILDAAPSADLWDGQTDEDEIGCSYDFVELYTEYLCLPAEEQERLVGTLSEEAKAQFHTLGAKIEAIHRRNKHKEKYPLNLTLDSLVLNF